MLCLEVILRFIYFVYIRFVICFLVWDLTLGKNATSSVHLQASRCTQEMYDTWLQRKRSDFWLKFSQQILITSICRVGFELTYSLFFGFDWLNNKICQACIGTFQAKFVCLPWFSSDFVVRVQEKPFRKMASWKEGNCLLQPSIYELCCCSLKRLVCRATWSQ